MSLAIKMVARGRYGVLVSGLRCFIRSAAGCAEFTTSDVNGDSNLALIVAIIALSTAVFVSHLASLATVNVTVPKVPRLSRKVPPQHGTKHRSVLHLLPR